MSAISPKKMDEHELRENVSTKYGFALCPAWRCRRHCPERESAPPWVWGPRHVLGAAGQILRLKCMAWPRVLILLFIRSFSETLKFATSEAVRGEPNEHGSECPAYLERLGRVGRAA